MTAELAKNGIFFNFPKIPPFSAPRPMKTVLTIAGFDPSSGAGVTADLMVFAAHGLFGTACITALTVQSTQGVRWMHPVSSEIVADTIEFLNADIRPTGIKIGMISSIDNLLIICKLCKLVDVEHLTAGWASRVPIVLDPVLRSSSGRELFDPLGVTAMRERLLPLVDWVTPNLDELAVLLNEPHVDRSEVPDACRALQVAVAANGNGERRLGIVATGGHLDRPDDFVLMPSGDCLWLPGERVITRSTHGTGCAFSSAFLSRLVLGDQAEDAARAAKAYVAGALQSSETIGKGNGPVNHLWPLVKLSA